MVRAFPGEKAPHTQRWVAPRGAREFGEWEFRLSDRQLARGVDGKYETDAANAYRDIVVVMTTICASLGWSQRELARRGGVSQAATSKALSGSVWPRWPTLVALIEALGLRLEFDGRKGDPIDAIFAVMDFADPFSIESGDRITGRSAAAALGIRPNTLFDLRNERDRAPSSATVFALAAYFDGPIRAVVADG